MKRLELNIFADYFQFYLMDAQIRPAAPDIWTEEDVKNRLLVAPNIVVVSPVRNMTVPVVIEVGEHEPLESDEEWDHIAECGIELPSGKLIVEACAEVVARLTVNSGSYRVRAFYGGLDSLSWNGLEGDDHYKVVLWPGWVTGIRVLKQWGGEASR